MYMDDEVYFTIDGYEFKIQNFLPFFPSLAIPRGDGTSVTLTKV